MSQKENTCTPESPAIAISGGVLKTARLRDEHYSFVADPQTFAKSIGHDGRRVDIFSFIQSLTDTNTRLPLQHHYDFEAVLRISTHSQWWQHQLKDKTRNMIRKSAKAGVEIRQSDFDDTFISGIHTIYNETPVRQGKPFWHYGKPIEVLRADHSTFINRSEFFGAYYKDQLIGFIKLVYDGDICHLMQIISMVQHRDKAPTNALISKAVERCSAKHIPLLHYGAWSRRSMGDFKRHHGFECVANPRYYIPLTPLGKLMLHAGLHRTLKERLPESWVDRVVAIRAWWFNFRLRSHAAHGAVAQLAERRL